MRTVYPLMGLAICAYGLYCVVQLHAFVGTNHYWNNPWHYKSLICMAMGFLLIWRIRSLK